MTYATFLASLTRLRPAVAHLIDRIERDLRKGIPWQAVTQEPGELSFSPQVWQALVLNAWKLQGVKRVTGAPYATHPTRMACYALNLIAAADEAEASAIFCLFHDYLEEGDGRDQAGVAQFLQDYPGPHEAVLCAIVLSEPMIDYQEFAGDRKDLEDVAYILQILGAKDLPFFRAYTTTSLLDKLDNLHHMEYITENPRYTAAVRAQKLRKKLAYFSFTLAFLGEHAHPVVVALLRESLEQTRQRFAVKADEVQACENHLQELFENNMYTMSLRIADYHERVLPTTLVPAKQSSSSRSSFPLRKI